MPVYKFTDGRKGWYFQFYHNKKKIKKERWNGKHMDSKAEALQAEFECKQQLEKVQNKGISIYQLYDEFCATAKGNLKESTKNGTYDKFKRQYLSLIDDIDIYDLTANDILNWKNKIGNIDSSADYKNRQLAIMKSCLSYGSIMYNIPGKLQFPLFEKIKDYSIIEIDNDKMEYIPPEDFKLLCSPLLEYPELEKTHNLFYYYVVINLLYYTGLRIGELAALTLNDFKYDYLIINKGYARIANKDVIQSPKNNNSIRKVILDEETKSLLENYIKIYKPNDVIFKLKGNYLNQQKLRRILRQLSDQANFTEKYDIHPHTLRHSHASNLRKLGYDEYVISHRLGNTPKVSATTYIHSEESEQYELVKKLR